MTGGRSHSIRGSESSRKASRGGVWAAAGVLIFCTAAAAQEIERAPINYSEAPRKNAISELQEKIAAGKVKIEYEPDHGYLRSFLKALDIPESSQVLVFSKTSLQRGRISPKTPRAIYFNDEVLVGFCLRGRVLEISAADESVGTAFYSLDQDPEEKPEVMPQTETCLICHSSSANRGMPGHLVRSLFVDSRGEPLLSSGSFRTDHASPLAERWGGWYVTGKSGDQKHMGNMITRGSQRPEEVDNAEGVNVVDLKDRLTISFYPTPHSDIVALMVLEHQTGMLNRLSRANLEGRMAMHYEREMNKALGRPLDEPSDSARSRIRSVGDDVVQYMLFQDEIKLTDRIEGTSTFTTDFMARGPKDSKGRSLRDLDLQSRLFRYPCSYLIYGRAFNTLPSEVKDYVYRRLWDLLNGKSTGKDDPQLASEDRQAILEILRETKPDLPDYWKEAR